MLEKLRVRSSRKEAFNWVLVLLEEEGVEKAEANPTDDRPARRDVFRSVATEHRKIIAVLPKIMVGKYSRQKFVVRLQFLCGRLLSSWNPIKRSLTASRTGKESHPNQKKLSR